MFGFRLLLNPRRSTKQMGYTVVIGVMIISVTLYITVSFTEQAIAKILEAQRLELQPVANEKDTDIDTDIITLSNTTFQGHYQDDEALVQYVQGLLHQPAPLSEPYNLQNPEKEHFCQFNQSYYADEVLNGMRDGFFVEVGAFTGEKDSNSLFFERSRGWSGLLIEANRENYKTLLSKNRKAYSILAALSVKNSSDVVNFWPGGIISKIVNWEKSRPIAAIPLYTMLLALGRTTIDFFSLDVEGAEYNVLLTIPWDKITAKLMCVEKAHSPRWKDIVKLLEKNGYDYLGIKDIDGWFAKKDSFPIKE